MKVQYDALVRQHGAAGYWPLGRHGVQEVIGGVHFTTVPQVRSILNAEDYTSMGPNQTLLGSSVTSQLANISLEIWIRPYTFPAAGSTIVSHGVPGTNGYELEWQTNGVFRANLGGVGTLGDCDTRLMRYEWNHIVFTRGATTWTYYVNGNLSDAAGTATPDAPTTTQIGSATSAQQDVRGLAVYTLELTPAQIREHYLLGLALIGPIFVASPNTTLIMGMFTMPIEAV